MKLLHGCQAKYPIINGVQVAVAPRESPPFPVDVMVFEEDTNLILTVDPIIEHEDEHIIRTMTDIIESKKHKLGSVVVSGNSLYAVVIHLDGESICREDWCDDALEQVIRIAEQKRISSLALPVLGTVHGNLQLEKQLQSLLDKIFSIMPDNLQYFWIVVSHEKIRRAKEIVNLIVAE